MPQPVSIIRKLLPYTTVASCLAVLYIGYVFYSRYSTNRDIQHRAEEKAAVENERAYEMYGAGQLKLMLFYASPPVVRHGEATKLCYSVSNATKVLIDHGVEAITPSLSHCVDIHPARTTVYTISAADDKGHTASQSVTVEVK